MEYRSYGAGIFKQSMGDRNRVGIGLSHRPASLHKLAEIIPWNQFLGSINVYKYGLWSQSITYLCLTRCFVKAKTTKKINFRVSFICSAPPAFFRQ
jgi:hypothetical protein